jgi:hypothetical protein
MKEFESVPHSELKQSYTCTWKHTVLGHRGDPDAKSTIIKMPVVLSVRRLYERPPCCSSPTRTGRSISTASAA